MQFQAVAHTLSHRSAIAKRLSERGSRGNEIHELFADRARCHFVAKSKWSRSPVCLFQPGDKPDSSTDINQYVNGTRICEHGELERFNNSRYMIPSMHCCHLCRVDGTNRQTPSDTPCRLTSCLSR